MGAAVRGGLHAEWGLRRVGEYPDPGVFVKMARILKNPLLSNFIPKP
jgi:hypothetical protein